MSGCGQVCHTGVKHIPDLLAPSAVECVLCIQSKHPNQQPVLIFPLGSINDDQLFGGCLEAQHLIVYKDR